MRVQTEVDYSGPPIIPTEVALDIAVRVLDQYPDSCPDRHLALCLIDWVMCANANGEDTIDQHEFLNTWSNAMRGASLRDFEIVPH